MDRSLMGRVEALERGMRFHRRLSGGLAALVALFVLSAFQEYEGPPEVIPAVVQARSFEVVDRDGEVQLRTGFRATGGFLEVMSGRGAPCIKFEAREEGGFASVGTARGEPTVLMSTNRYGGALRILTEDGKPTFVVGVDRSTSFLNMLAKGTPFFRATSGPTGDGVVQVYDKLGTLRGDLGEEDRMVPAVLQARRLEVVDEDGLAIFRVSETHAGGQLELLNSQGSTVFRTFAAESGGHVAVLDSLANEVVSVSTTRDGGQFALYNRGGRTSFLASVTRLAAELSIFGSSNAPIVSLGNDYRGDGHVRVAKLRGGSEKELKVD